MNINRSTIRKLIMEELSKMGRSQPAGYMRHPMGCDCYRCSGMDLSKLDAAQKQAMRVDTEDKELELESDCGSMEEEEEGVLPESWERIAFGRPGEGFGIGMISPSKLSESKKK